MTQLTDEALSRLESAQISVSQWDRYTSGILNTADATPTTYDNGGDWDNPPEWKGDACGCPDDRCIGHHHSAEEPCGCIRSLITSYPDELWA